MIDQCDENVRTSNTYRGMTVAQSICDDIKKTTMNEILKKVSTRLCLDTFGDGAACLDEVNGILLTLVVRVRGCEDGKELLNEILARLNVVNNVDLIVKDERVEDGEGGVIENTG